jgi:hypothetical protein
VVNSNASVNRVDPVTEVADLEVLGRPAIWGDSPARLPAADYSSVVITPHLLGYFKILLEWDERDERESEPEAAAFAESPDSRAQSGA